MKRYLIVLIIITLILGFACNNSDNSKNKGITKDTIKVNNTYLDQIIFGIYCGECNKNCATMYCYNMMGNANTLFVDYTDSYFRSNGEINFATQITDRNKFKLASDIVAHIPKYLLTTNKKSEKFGCPDCSDGCGIYFEILQDRNRIIKKFYIDTDTSQLTGDVKTFSTYLRTTIHKMKK